MTTQINGIDVEKSITDQFENSGETTLYVIHSPRYDGQVWAVYTSEDEANKVASLLNETDTFTFGNPVVYPVKLNPKVEDLWTKK